MKSGIYAISHIATNRHYVGSSRDVRARWKCHRSMLNAGTHHSPHLQRAWLKYGADAFAFVVLEYVENFDDLLQCEQVWIDRLRAGEPARGFNTAPIAGTRAGVPHSEDVKRAMSLARKGRAKSPEHRAAIGAANKGKKRTPGMIAEIVERNTLAMSTPEQRAKQSEYGKRAQGQKGRLMSDAAKAKMSATRKSMTLLRDDKGHIIGALPKAIH